MKESVVKAFSHLCSIVKLSFEREFISKYQIRHLAMRHSHSSLKLEICDTKNAEIYIHFRNSCLNKQYVW